MRHNALWSARLLACVAGVRKGRGRELGRETTRLPKLQNWTPLAILLKENKLVRPFCLFSSFSNKCKALRVVYFLFLFCFWRSKYESGNLQNFVLATNINLTSFRILQRAHTCVCELEMYLSCHFVLKRPYLSPTELNHQCILLKVHKELFWFRYTPPQPIRAAGCCSADEPGTMNVHFVAHCIKLSIFQAKSLPYQELFCIATLPTSLADRNEKIKKQQVKCISQFHLRPVPPSGLTPGHKHFFASDGKFPGVGTLELSGWGRKKRANAPSSVNTATFFIDRTVKECHFKHFNVRFFGSINVFLCNTVILIKTSRRDDTSLWF